MSTRADRLAPPALLWAAWFGAAAATVAWALHASNGLGTMGFGVATFELMWLLMMAAMMLPTAVRAARTTRPAPMVLGYLSVWAATGFPAYLLAAGDGHLADDHLIAARVAGVAAFAVAGVYQFTSAKDGATRRCAGVAAADTWRSGVRLGGWCVAGSWAAMPALVTAGVMNITAMVAIAVVLYAERYWFPERTFRRLTGLAALAATPLIWVHTAPAMMK